MTIEAVAPPAVRGEGEDRILTIPNGITVNPVATIDTRLAPSPTSRTTSVDAAQLSLLAFEP